MTTQPTPRAQRRSDDVEHTIVQRILNGDYAPGARLPLERDLAAELGVGRPTLREALQRLERDGWLTVRKSAGTIINDYWRTGGLSLLPGLVRCGQLTNELVIWLLELRVALAPTYVAQAVAAQPARVVAVLVDHQTLADDARAYAEFDIRWQMSLAELAPNPLFGMTMRSFGVETIDPYAEYFEPAANRALSRAFYAELMQAAMSSDAARARELTRSMMKESIARWRTGHTEE
jgi:GntR family transcriptional regulator, negative regulator for fad regulon and positive regulator of fabA